MSADFNGITSNSKKIDLFLYESGQTVCIFEVKASSDTQSVYTAIGQLFYHGLSKPKAKKIIVLPNTLKDNAKNSLETLGLKVVIFRKLDDGLILFDYLDEAINDGYENGV